VNTDLRLRFETVDKDAMGEMLRLSNIDGRIYTVRSSTVSAVQQIKANNFLFVLNINAVLYMEML